MTPETAYVLLAVILVLFLAGATAKAASDKRAALVYCGVSTAGHRLGRSAFSR
jgi:hypothetical protein